MGGFVEIAREQTQLGVPAFPLFLGYEEIVSNIAEEFHLHNVYFLNRDPRDFGPGFVGIGVIIENCILPLAS